MATALVLMFVFTAGGVIWLARDVDRATSNRGAAQSIAFQAARSGAQQVDLAHLRTWDVVVVDEPAARIESVAVAGRLLDAYGLTGEVTSIEVEPDRVTVVVTVVDGGRSVTGIGSARATDGREVP
ncbi:MAG: hypothetical protein WD225_12400 [Ilumatobacteraceae bacterium]